MTVNFDAAADALYVRLRDLPVAWTDELGNGRTVDYDAEGQVLSASLLDYALPSASSIPDWTLGQTVTPSPLNPLGVKGIGEAGPIGVPPTIVSAVLDALAPLGVTDLNPPLHAEKLWRTIREAETGGGSRSPSVRT